MTFGDALAHLKRGGHVCREGWNGKGMWLTLQVPDINSKMTHPYIYIEYPAGHAAYPAGSRVPWLASQTDLLAEDWMGLHMSDCAMHGSPAIPAEACDCAGT